MKYTILTDNTITYEFNTWEEFVTKLQIIAVTRQCCGDKYFDVVIENQEEEI